MGKLNKVARALNKTDEKDKDSLDKSLSVAVRSNTDALAQRVENGLQQLNTVSNKSRELIANALVAEIEKLVLESTSAFKKRLDQLETRLSKSEQLGRDNVKVLVGGMESSVLQSMKSLDVSKELTGIVDSLSNIPTESTDTTALSDMMVDLIGKVGDIEIPEVIIPKPKDQWTFRIERDGEDLIQRVVVN